LAIDTREKELREKLVQVKTELRKLKNRQKNIANSGVTNADIIRQNKLVEDAEKDLTTFRNERIERLGGAKKQREQEDLVKKQDELAELERRSQEGEFAPKPGVFKGGVPEREVSVKDIERAKKQVEKRQPEVLDKPTETTTATTTTGYNAALTTEGRTVPVAKYISNVSDLANIEPTSIGGIFNSEIGEETIFLPPVGKQVSEGITLNQFTNNIWGLSPAQITEFKKAINYKDKTGVATEDFANALIKRVLPVSEANYRNAMNNKPSASWEELVINPAKYTQYVGSSLAGGVGAGPSAQDIKVKADAIRIYATDLGVGLDDGAVNKLAREWASGNFDATTIKPQIARSGKIDFAKGSAAEQLNSLKELAGSFGMQYDEGWYNTAATNVLTGKDDIETYKQYVKDQAKSKFPTLSAQLDQGFTVRQLASPYVQTMSNILEIDPNTIGLNDIYVNQALTGLNDKGEPSTKPLWQFEQDLRKDPRWNFTKNAQDSLMGTARKVLQDFGLVS
jgi:hypothetical protein